MAQHMWPRPPVTERRDPDGRSTRVGYVLRRWGFERHCGIVTRVCLVRGGRQNEATTAVTASRDGTLKCWDIPANETHGGASSSTAPPPQPQLRCSLEEHTAWVNDAVVLPPTSSNANATQDSRRVVSASSDNLVKVWHVDEEKQGVGVTGALMSLRYHVDYVTCLAYASHRALLVSAGLDSRVVVSDLEAATRVLNLPSGEDEYQTAPGRTAASPHRAGGVNTSLAQRCAVGSFSGSGQYIPNLLMSPGHANRQEGGGYGGEEGGGGREGSSCGASVWSLATTLNSSLLVCGTASCVVRGWDPRSGQRLWRLRGHTENVRALVLSDDGTICISGSADRTVRVWDVGMRRCVHVFDAHHDSVWALAVAGYSCGWSNPAGTDGAGAGNMLSEVFSGGRDGLVLVHDLRLLQTGLVAREPSPLQALAVSAEASTVWAPAADSHVRCHSVPHSLVPYGFHSGLADTVPPPGASPEPVPGLPPAAGDDTIVIAGTPRLVDYKVLHNKRQVLVRDALDQLSLWDVTNGQSADFALPAAPAGGTAPGPGKADDVMKRALAQINKPVSVPNWFSCDLSLGSLSVYLDATQCFKAESEDTNAVLPTGAFAGGGVARSGQLRTTDSASEAPVNLGARTLRTLFESWVRQPQGGGGAAVAGQANRAGNTTPTGFRRGAAGSFPRVFVAPPALNDAAGAGGTAQRWDDDQPPGTPADQAAPTEAPAGGASSSSFPPATGLVLVGRNGRAAGYRGRLYCGLFNGTEVPDLLPPWVVDVVWNQRPPPEELCGERNMLFTLMRCPSEMALPSLQTHYCIAAPRTHIRRLMSYLVRVLDFDWAAPAKATARRQGSAVSLVSRLGRCCTVPASRGRANSADYEGDNSGSHPARSGSSGSHRRSASSRERTSSSNGSQNGRSARSFGLRRGEEEAAGGPSSAAGRIRIDGSPAPLPSVPAQAAGRNRSSPAGGVAPDERFVDLLCNDLLVDPDMSLATVRDFFWRQSGKELVLTYRRAKHVVMPTSPAPPPPLLPGGGQNGVHTAGGITAAAPISSDMSEDVTSELNGPADSNPASPGRGIDGTGATDSREAGGPPRE